MAKEPKHPLVEFGLDRGIKIACLLSLLERFGSMGRRRLREMAEELYGVKVTRTQAFNLVSLLRVYGYVRQEYVPGKVKPERVYTITEKGRRLLERLRREMAKLTKILE